MDDKNSPLVNVLLGTYLVLSIAITSVRLVEAYKDRKKKCKCRKDL